MTFQDSIELRALALAGTIIQDLEGFRPAPYKDPLHGVVTIGYGHTRSAVMPARVTEEEALRLLGEDLQYFLEALHGLVKVPLPLYRLVALLSFVFNVGEGSLGRSRNSPLLPLNAGDWRAGAQKLRLWDGPPDKKLRGLTFRRGIEFGLWMLQAPVMPDVSTHRPAELYLRLTKPTQRKRVGKRMQKQFNTDLQGGVAVFVHGNQLIWLPRSLRGEEAQNEPGQGAEEGAGGEGAGDDVRDPAPPAEAGGGPDPSDQ